MNAQQLLEYMRQGAILRSQKSYSYPHHVKHVRNTVTLPDGTVLETQTSNINALLKRREIKTKYIQNWTTEYMVSKQGDSL